MSRILTLLKIEVSIITMIRSAMGNHFAIVQVIFGDNKIIIVVYKMRIYAYIFIIYTTYTIE